MEWLQALSPMSGVLLFIFLVFCAYLSGGLIGFFSMGYGDKKTLAWLEENKADFSELFYKREKKIITDRGCESSIARPKRMRAYRVISALLYLALITVSPSAQGFLLLAVVFTILLWLSSVDIDSHHVPERFLYFLVIFELGFFSFIPNARWTGSEGILLGVFLVFSFVTLSIFIARRFIRGEQNEGSMIFGDGDILTLIALTLFFGTDVLIALGVASFLFVVASVLKTPYLFLLDKVGHFTPLAATTHEMAFIPFIFIGLFFVVSMKLLGVMDLSTAIEQLYLLVMFDGLFATALPPPLPNPSL